MNAARSIANADRIENISKQTMYVQDNRQQYSRQAPFTLPTSSRPADAQSNCRIGGITDRSYANQLKIPAMNQQQRLLNLTKTGPNGGTVLTTGGATSVTADLKKQSGPPSEPVTLLSDVTSDDQSIAPRSVPNDDQNGNKQLISNNDPADNTNRETADTALLDVQQTSNENIDLNHNGDTTKTTCELRDNLLQKQTLNPENSVPPKTNNEKSALAINNPTYVENEWKLPPKHARKMERFLNKNSVHGTAVSTKVKGATAPPDELFISRVDGDTTEADMAEYILELGVHIIDLELTSHHEARNKSFKLTVNKNDFYKLLDASLWPDGVKVGRYRKPKNNREYSNRQYI